jgi:hypothetical protein
VEIVTMTSARPSGWGSAMAPASVGARRSHHAGHTSYGIG